MLSHETSSWSVHLVGSLHSCGSRNATAFTSLPLTHPRPDLSALWLTIERFALALALAGETESVTQPVSK